MNDDIRSRIFAATGQSGRNGWNRGNAIAKQFATKRRYATPRGASGAGGGRGGG